MRFFSYWNEQRQQVRHSETQRATVTNYILLIVSALAGLIVQQRFQPSTIPLSLLIAVIGLYGAITCAKYHERAEYHLTQARSLTRTLVGLGALPDIRDLLAQTRNTHYLKYPRLHRLRLHHLWTGLHLAITAFGTTLASISVIVSIT